MMIDSLRAALETCAFCPKLCRFACPVAEAEGQEAVTPWGLLTRADDLRRQLATLDGPMATLWTHCTGCGACTAQCKHENPVAETIYGLRALSVESGVQDARLMEWAQAKPCTDVLNTLPSEGRILVVPGHLPKSQVEDWLKVLGLVGVRDMYALPQFTTAGGRWVQSGQQSIFNAHVDALLPAANQAEVILCLNPDDYQTLRTAWGTRLDTTVRIQHALHALLPVVDQLTPCYDGDLVLLDSCRLSREPALASGARSILNRLISGRLIETLMHGTEAGCCGAGAGFSTIHPYHGKNVAREAVMDTEMADIVAFGECVGHLQNATAGRNVYSFEALVLKSLSEGGDL